MLDGIIEQQPQSLTPTLGDQNKLNGLEKPEINKDQQITAIIDKDRKAFEEWQNSGENTKKFNIPHKALRYILISKRALELSEDPTKVELLVINNDDNNLEAFVIEHKTHPITNEASLKLHWDNEKRLAEEEKAKAKAQGIPYIFSPPIPPPDVDLYHDWNRKLIEEGKLGLNDYVMNDVVFYSDNNEILTVSRYFDRSELRHKGVATSFYIRLHELAIRMGYRFITGGNSKTNVNYFTDRLGRYTLAQIKPEFKKLFHDKPEATTQEEYTIDFLHPDDIDYFVIK